MHTTKRAVLLSCSDHYNHRLYVIDGYLRSLGYETVYYTSDFDHTSKKVFRCTVPGCRQIHVRPYQKNLSLSRILSHRDHTVDLLKAVWSYDYEKWGRS